MRRQLTSLWFPQRSRTSRSSASLAVVGLAWLLVGCGGLTDQSAPVGGAGCPTAVRRLVDPARVAGAEISLVVDGSGSFLGDRAAARSFVASQVAAVVDESIAAGAALRVIVFAGSAGNARSVVECPVLAARFRNEAAREVKTNRLREAARREVWRAVLEGRPPMARPGTSVIGGYVALADARPLHPGPRTALMLSDGIALPEYAVSVDLSGFHLVGMYGVGRAEPPASTPKVDRLRRTWQRWLVDQGAHEVVVSSQGFSR